MDGQGTVKRAARSPLVEHVARWGLICRGAVYVLVGVLAVRVAQGHGEKRADKQGALQAVADHPLGKVVLGAVAVGFAGYALWRFAEAVAGPPDEDDDKKAAVKRVGYAARGVLYSALFLSAVRLLVRSGEGGDGEAQADWTARVLGWPAGPLLVGAVGVAIVAGGLYVGWRGVTRKNTERLKTHEMRPAERQAVTGVAVVGMVARMVVTTLIGVFLVQAAVDYNPRKAVGIDGALKRLADRSSGPLLLVLVALGLMAYGVYSLAEARYRRIGGR